MERELTSQAFSRLLERLGDNEEQAAHNYEDLRHTLIRSFEWRGAPFPEEHADETFNRLARKLDEGVEIRNIGEYAYSIAVGLARDLTLPEKNFKLSLSI